MKVQKIRQDNSAALDDFLETLCRFLLENGVDRAGILSVEALAFGHENQDPDPENASSYWPRVRYSKDSMPAMLGAFQKAVVFSVDWTGGRARIQRKVCGIAAMAEARCFYGGFHLAASLGAGNCRTLFCGEETGCQSLKRGRGCRHPLVARPSPEACGLDARQVREAAGWEPEEVSPGCMGMVFVD